MAEDLREDCSGMIRFVWECMCGENRRLHARIAKRENLASPEARDRGSGNNDLHVHRNSPSDTERTCLVTADPWSPPFRGWRPHVALTAPTNGCRIAGGSRRMKFRAAWLVL